MTAAVHATIDDRSVSLEDWQCDSVANGGPRTFTAKVPGNATWAEQEAPVRVWLPDGTDLWAGRLTVDPVLARGKLQVRAEGYGADIAASPTRMFYRSDGTLNGWADKESDPFGGTNNDKYDLQQFPGLLRFKMPGSDTWVANDQAGFAVYVENSLITRYSIRVAPGASYAAFTLETFTFDGPATGTNTAITTHSLAIGAPTTYAQTISAITPPESGLILRIVTSGAASGTRRVVNVTAIKIYGRTLSDTFSASDVVTDVAQDAGLDASLVQTNPLAVLPLDWPGDKTELLTYIANLTDWHWEPVGPVEAGEPARVMFGPWETVVSADSATGIVPEWEYLKRFNKVKVPFNYVSGAPGEAFALADPDPFPGRDVIYEADALKDEQTSADLAESVAAALAPYRAQRNRAGRIEVGRVYGPTGVPMDGFHVKPGYLIDTGESGLPPQRIVGMSYRASGPPVADVGKDFNVIRLLAKLQTDQRRRKGRK